MNSSEIRYTFEHRILPLNFYEYRTDFIALLLKRKDIIFQVLNDIYREEKVENPYSKNDFEIKLVNMDEKFISIKLIFPYPEEEPLCYYSYLFIDKELQNLKYFCVERGAKPEDAYISLWTSAKDHINYGRCSIDEYECYKKCLQIYNGE